MRDYCATEPNEAGQVTTLAAVPYGGCGAGKITMWKFLVALRFSRCFWDFATQQGIEPEPGVDVSPKNTRFETLSSANKTII